MSCTPARLALVSVLALALPVALACHKKTGDADSDGGKKHGHKGNDGGITPDAGAGKLVINKATTNPLAPPALHKPPKLPTLPTLPPRDAYAKEDPPPKPESSEGCGEIWTGSEYIPVDCIDPDARAKHPRAAKVVVPYDKMKVPADKLPQMVDHRFDGTEGPMRMQGGTECTAFAFTAALDHAYARWTGSPGAFSVMQVWARYHKHDEVSASVGNVGDLIANESEWPYDKTLSLTWHTCNKDASKRKGPCSQPVDVAKLDAVTKRSVAQVSQVEFVTAPTADLLREKLAAGQDATVAVRMKSFATAGKSGSKYVIGKSLPGKGDKASSHQILIAGYATTPTGSYFLIHNSWGTKWADQGYAWIHEDILTQVWEAGTMAIPDVQPIDVARLREGSSGGLTTKCDGDKVPDSISAQCAGKCPDGSPRHNDVCADEKQNPCPAGHVNLTGECVLAAPKASDTEGGVKWACAEGGCTYEVPQGQLGCKERACQVSCPAPSFRLATTPKGLVCVE